LLEQIAHKFADALAEQAAADTHFRVQGPAVDGLAAEFSQNWAESDNGWSGSPSTRGGQRATSRVRHGSYERV
jgi:phosphatidylserine/phosphatidylglycerophosphate/cardiolipin synthase-like enzyme